VVVFGATLIQVLPYLSKTSAKHVVPLGPKDLVVACQCESVPDIVLLDSLHSLRASLLADIKRLNERFDILLAGQLEHGKHLRSATDVAASHLGSIGSEVLSHHGGKWLVWQTNVVELAIDVQRGHVLLDVEGVGHVCGVEDEIKFESILLGPVLLACNDEFFGAQLQGIVFLVRGV